MCIGESGRDTLDSAEQDVIERIAREACPAHAFSLRRNDDGITWAVLTPRGSHLPRFTICRIAPCLVVMIEIGQAPRLFRSVADMEAAGIVLRDVSEDALRGASGRHGVH